MSACGLRVSLALSLVFSMASPTPVAAASGLVGRWEGKIDPSGKAQAISVEFTMSDKGWQGSIDLPDEGILGRPLQRILFEAGGVHFETQVMKVSLIFDGKLDGDKITGTFLQGNEKLAFILERKSALDRSSSSATSVIARNQPVALSNEQAGTRGQTRLSRDKDEDAHLAEATRKGTDYALLFGCDEYDKGWKKLANPASDVDAVADVLRQVYHFKVQVVKNPTKEVIKTTLREYKTRSFSKQDQLLIFFAGHGTYDSEIDRGFLVAKDSDMNDENKGSYLDFDALEKMVDAIPCEHIFLVLDACYGGTALSAVGPRGNEYLPKPIAKIETVIQKLETYPTRKILTSGGKEYVGDGVPGHHSPFARNFLAALGDFGDPGTFFDIFEIYGKLNKYRDPKDAEPQFGSFGRDLRPGDFYFIVTSTLQTPPKN